VRTGTGHFRNRDPFSVLLVVERRADGGRLPPGPDRWRERSRFFSGIAAAMADQWGEYATQQFYQEAA